MDAFSEIEIEVLVEEVFALEQADTLVADNSMVLEIELEDLTMFLDNQQIFDGFEHEWLRSATDVIQVIDSDAADWLTAFIDTDVESDATAPDKPKINYTEVIDEIVTTGTINTSWDYTDILDFLATMESIGDGVLVGDEDSPDIPDRWKVKPPTTPTDGVQVDRNGLTIPGNQGTDEQEDIEDLLAGLWTSLMKAESGDPTVEWGSEYNENTGRYHVFPLPPVWVNLNE